MATRIELERLSVVETEVKNVKLDVKELKVSVKDGFDGLNLRLDNLDKKYAPKWVQTVVAGFISAVLLAFIAVVINFFIPSKSPSSVQQQPSTGHTTTTTTPTGSTSTTQTTPMKN